MLATVILDVFSLERAEELAAAIDELCPPAGGGPFASSGLYAFWDPASRDLLYLGLARDLGIRFRQHSGLLSCDSKGCKVEHVRCWFQHHALLGHSILPQSPLDQADCARARAPYCDDLRARAALEEQAAPGEEELRAAEGQLLQANVNRYGHLPPWNTYGGSKHGAARATSNTEPMLDLMRARYRHTLTSRLATRDLANHALAAYYENILHAARWNMLLRYEGADDEMLRAEIERLAAGPDWSGSGSFRQLLDSGYLDHYLLDARSPSQ